MPAKVLSHGFFNRPTLQVARSLLGTYLVRENGSGLLAGRIVEVEAYVGPEDRASHAFRGRTKRTEVMFGRAGIAYVYLVYGMHHCFNIVTERVGYPAAILVRAVEVVGDAEQVPPLVRHPQKRSLPSQRLSLGVIDGPGRVCRAFEIDRSLNTLDVTAGETLWIEDRGHRVSESEIAAFPRIGVNYAGEWATKPWRFRLRCW